MRSTVCETVRCPSVCPSVCPFRLLQQRAAGLLLCARWAGDDDQRRAADECGQYQVVSVRRYLNKDLLICETVRELFDIPVNGKQLESILHRADERDRWGNIGISDCPVCVIMVQILGILSSRFMTRKVFGTQVHSTGCVYYNR